MRIARIRQRRSTHLAVVAGSGSDEFLVDLTAVARDRRVGLPQAAVRTLTGFIGLCPAALDAARAAADLAASERLPRLDPGAVGWLPAVDPTSTVVCAGRNFKDHREESFERWGRAGFDIQETSVPTGFVKIPGALTGHCAEVSIPSGVRHLDYEVEIAAVIGSWPPVATPLLRSVFGYTVFNDLADRDLQAEEMSQQMLLAGKNRAGFGPIGPWITTSDEISDPTRLELRLTVNGEIRQHAYASDMIHEFTDLLRSWALLPLKPGDAITSGTPAGSAIGHRPDPEGWYLRSGDRIEAEVSGIGKLTTLIAP